MPLLRWPWPRSRASLFLLIYCLVYTATWCPLAVVPPIYHRRTQPFVPRFFFFAVHSRAPRPIHLYRSPAPALSSQARDNLPVLTAWAVCCVLVLRACAGRYTLYFATNLACAAASRPPVPSYGPRTRGSEKLSGGWGFIIFVVVASVVYVVGGMVYVKHSTRKWGFPNASFWERLGDYVNDGITVVLGCGRKNLTAGSGSGYAVHASSPYDSVPAVSAPSGGTSGGYHSSGPAYTDI